MDLSESIAPRSDQLNADDLLAHPITVTIAGVTKGTAEQPVNVELVEYPGRPYKPSKSMRRVMVVAWGTDAVQYTGRRLKLYRNPDITFGRDKVGGIEIAAMSDITGPLTLALTATRGRRKEFTVQPLEDSPWISELGSAKTLDDLATIWNRAGEARRDPAVIAAKDKRKQELG